MDTMEPPLLSLNNSLLFFQRSQFRFENQPIVFIIAGCISCHFPYHALVECIVKRNPSIQNSLQGEKQRTSFIQSVAIRFYR